MSNRLVVLTGLALAAVLCLTGQTFAQKSSPTVRSMKVDDEEARKLNVPLKQGVNKVATLKTGEPVFVRLKGNKVVEMFAEDEKGQKVPASNLEERKLKVTGSIQICGVLFKKFKVCVVISGV